MATPRTSSIRLRRPDPDALERYRLACESRPLNVAGIGLDWLDAPPPGFVRDRYGATLGAGSACYAAAVAALDGWAMYPGDWAQVHARGDLAPGSVYVAVIRGYGLYTLLPSHVLEVFDEPGPDRRHGFGFATVRGHLEQGVERFEVSWSARTDEVRFDACAVSRPGPLLRAVAPLARRLQLRFHRESPGAMRSAVAAALVGSR